MTGAGGIKSAVAGGLVALAVILGAGCASPAYVGRPVDVTPYDHRLDDLNRRLCAERGGRWIQAFTPQGNFLVLTGGRCVTPIDALAAAMIEVRRFRYRADRPGVDAWQTPAETEARGEGDCEDLSAWVVWRARVLAGVGDFRLVAGLADGEPHAWVELAAPWGPLWADPTPGWSKAIEPPTRWNRTPQYAYGWDGEQFSAKWKYDRIGA